MNEQIKRIEELVNDFDLTPNITYSTMSEILFNCSFNDLEKMVWELYCFASDVKEAIERGVIA